MGVLELGLSRFGQGEPLLEVALYSPKLLNQSAAIS
jgi:hypothetical protein